ncbi:MAG TPA: Verru_Chthon cassette protein A [Prosthecobacter sp.]|nr:Verru_Chthon cassette protein A [Prosthecobacter sp.]
MKPLKQFLSDARRNKGLALIIVLSMLALATIVILAFLSVADTEYKATVTFSSSQSARRHADTAVNIVISQIRSGSAREPEPAPGAVQYPATPVIHATQPGGVRKYNQAGNFIGGYKLFSDSNMIVRPVGASPVQAKAAERKFVEDSEPPADWDEGNKLSRYVDLNEPVIKGVATATGDMREEVQIVFPIIDPRAGLDVDPNPGDEIPVEGFSYSAFTAIKRNNLDNEAGDRVVDPNETGSARNAADALRLPMPVQWLYVLKDGTVGHLDDNLQFVSSEGTATADNPMVSRIAFWTDDETCKININTASEPTFMGQPIYYHERDHRWADFPPARSEYQRFPGHPATVALSSVLYPNPLQVSGRKLETYPLGVDFDRILSVKEKIYELMPRIHTDGSKGGTQLFGNDDFDQGATRATAVAISAAANERLYASVDELLFSQNVADGKRVQNTSVIKGGSLFNKQTLERTSAFLTASSRGSEISMYGLPKVTMWPIATDSTRRTGFDQLIKFCSTLDAKEGSSNFYIFQREKALDENFDINIKRNDQLMAMLDKIMQTRFPAASDALEAGKSYTNKFGQDNQRQLLVEMFDYIRCTNLYDGYLAPERDSWRTRSNTDWVNQYKDRDLLQSQGFFKTYTPGFVKQDANEFNDRALPGHGQVTPAVWRIGGSNNVYRGFGRSVSISEVGLHFICTADGQPDMYSWRMPERDPTGTPGLPRKYRIPAVDINNYQALEQDAWHPEDNPNGRISGGRSALIVDRTKQNVFRILHEYPPGFDGSNAVLTNLAEHYWQNPDSDYGTMKMRYWSNFPPLDDPTGFGLYGTGSGLPPTVDNYVKSFHFHPGYHWWNWNYTLERNTPLRYNEKRIQAMVHLEFFCPSVGYPELHPEFTMVLSGSDVSTIKVNGKSVFSTTKDVIIKSGQALFHPDDHPEIGGFASFRKLASGRLAPARGGMPPDVNYVSDVSGDPHAGINNMDLISSFFTTDRDAPLTFSSGVITVNIYDSHDYNGRDPIQRIQFQLAEGQAPPPDLVVVPTYNVHRVRDDNSIYNHPAVQAPRWWTFNRGGALGRIRAPTDGSEPQPVDPEDRNTWTEQFWNRGRMVQVADATVQATTARDINLPDTLDFNQRLPGANQLIFAYENSTNFGNVRADNADVLRANPNRRIAYGPDGDINRDDVNRDRPTHHFGTDTIRTMQPKNGDPRIIYAKKFVPASEWTPHILWNSADVYNAHNFSSYTAGGEPGFDRYGTSTVPTDIDQQAARRMLPSRVKNGTSILSASFWPDVPANGVAHEVAQRYFDFDDSDPGGRVGPFINKPDEGNYAVGNYQASGWPAPKRWRATYFRTGIGARTSAAGQSFFTPNRMISSPVMMGSLPPTIFGGDPVGNYASPNDSGAWRNLLFRPHVQYGDPNMRSTHPGAVTPPDHYLLDLFWMPVVEPYAISEALSTAGKINMNYQIVPFTHIRRATAMHAAMKGEMFATMPDTDYEASKSVKTGWGPNGSTAPVFRDEINESRYWHRNIAIDRIVADGGDSAHWWKQDVADRVEGTLRQFEERFYFGAGPTAKNGQDLPTEHRGGLFRSPSQICEIHLIPARLRNDFGGGNRVIKAEDVKSYNTRRQKMAAFWHAHSPTGDNTRERPYSNLYAKLTTRSNTFRVHVRAQTIGKAGRSVPADTFDPSTDKILAEFRGSFLLERYIDTRDANLPDYADGGDPFAKPPLESFYRFRVLESKRFAP